MPTDKFLSAKSRLEFRELRRSAGLEFEEAGNHARYAPVCVRDREGSCNASF